MVATLTRIGQSFPRQSATCPYRPFSLSSSLNHNHPHPIHNTIINIQGVKRSSSIVVHQCSGTSSTSRTHKANYPLNMGLKKLEDIPLQEEEQQQHQQQERSPLLFSSRDAIQCYYKGRYDETRIQELVACIKEKLKEGKLIDGEVSISPYDTAWVARIPSSNDANHPQFPRTLQWILQHQMRDGSWGEETYFLTYDRIVNTLACIIALKTWNLSPPAINRGVEFLWRNFEKLQYESLDHMLSGFEVVVTSMLEEAQRLGLDLPYNSEFVNRLMKIREEKFQRLPIEHIHTYPTTLLYSLEGLTGLIDWNKILKLQSTNGSFLTSPASTACVYLHTKDPKCLDYLISTLSHYNDEAVPCHYPVDLFERLWLVDVIERLGVSHYFQEEIQVALNYVHGYWTNEGIGWGREVSVHDIDDTAMGFRLLRFHGYNVSSDVFQQFTKDGKFFCFPGENRHGVSEMFNVYRASQIGFPSETILEHASVYSKTYLERAISSSASLDKWSLKKDLHGEIINALKHPWHYTLPRVETRKYIDQYGADDVWLAKSIYKLPLVNNNEIITLAKEDFNKCQDLHRRELDYLISWWEQTGLSNFPFMQSMLIESCFRITSSLHEPKYSEERISFAKACALVGTVKASLWDYQILQEEIQLCSNFINGWDLSILQDTSSNIRKVFEVVHKQVMDWASIATSIHGRKDVGQLIIQSWKDMLGAIVNEAKIFHSHSSNHAITMSEERFETTILSTGVWTIALTTILAMRNEVDLDSETLKSFGYTSNSSWLACLTRCIVKDFNEFTLELDSYRNPFAIKVVGANVEDNFSIPNTSKSSIEKWNDKMLLQLNEEFFKNGASSRNKIWNIIWRRLVFDGIVRSMYMFQSKELVFGNDYENLKHVIDMVLFKPTIL